MQFWYSKFWRIFSASGKLQLTIIFEWMKWNSKSRVKDLVNFDSFAIYRITATPFRSVLNKVKPKLSLQSWSRFLCLLWWPLNFHRVGNGSNISLRLSILLEFAISLWFCIFTAEKTEITCQSGFRFLFSRNLMKRYFIS